MTDTERDRINAICEVAGVTEIDDLSDGFHTFRQLYYQRMMLFATIVKQNKDKAWKSLRHEDGELCFGGGWFIVGIDTPEGSYTYHYEDNYYSLFDCEELERGKHWDGHTEKDVTRLLSLPKAQLSCECTTSALISRTETVEHLRRVLEATVPNTDYDEGFIDGVEFGISTVLTMPTIQPVATDTNVGDKISKFIDGLEETFAYIREREGGDSVCGLCEYDGAYIGESGDWCNECPGFNRDDCFRLSDKTRKEWTEEIIKALPPVQPERKKGAWMPYDTIPQYVICRCSACGTDILVPCINDKTIYNYCPNCGAKMTISK